MRNLVYIVLVFSFSFIQNLAGQNVGTEIGDKAPEIRLPSPGGDTIALSSLKGKLVLIDFWATWCAPCVKEQPELARLYKKYKNVEFTNGKGFEIYGVSMDSKKENWQGIIDKNAISWVQVSDLRFWSSPVAKLYNLQEIPYNLLIDGKGIILAKNLHGKELDQALARFLAP